MRAPPANSFAFYSDTLSEELLADATLFTRAPFDPALVAVLSRHAFPLHDFFRTNNDEAFFYDTDHLNREGVLRLIDAHLKTILAPVR